MVIDYSYEFKLLDEIIMYGEGSYEWKGKGADEADFVYSKLQEDNVLCLSAICFCIIVLFVYGITR